MPSWDLSIEMHVLGTLVHEITHWAQFSNVTFEEWWGNTQVKRKHNVWEKNADWVSEVALDGNDHFPLANSITIEKLVGQTPV